MTDWKDEFYSKYSTLFGRKVSESSFQMFKPYGKHIIRKCFPDEKRIKVLDLGCGFGGYLRVFSEQGYTNIEGIDISEEDVNYAHQFGLSQVKQGELFSTLRSIKDNQYDVVLLLDVIEHFMQEQILVIINESYRILRSGGCLILHVPNAEGIFGNRIRYDDFTHEMAFTGKSLTQISKYAGFSQCECFEDKPLAYSITGLIRRCLWPVVTIPFRILHAIETGTYSVRLSQNILFKAVKP